MPRSHLNDHQLTLSHVGTKETKTKKYSFNELYEASGFKTKSIILKGTIFIQIIFLKVSLLLGIQFRIRIFTLLIHGPRFDPHNQKI